ncbi:hypothetical protein JCM6882_009308 [Rhodosporidiobolus microsporus]
MSLRALVLALAVLGGVAAAPSPDPAPAPAPVDTLLQTNLFGFVERKAIPLPAPSSPSSGGSDSAVVHSHPPNVAWDPLGFAAEAGNAFVASSAPARRGRNRAARLVSTERHQRWTPAPSGSQEEGGDEPGEELAEGDEEEEELVEDDEDDDDEGDMLGDDGWFRRRMKRSTVVVVTEEKVARSRRSWKSRR